MTAKRGETFWDCLAHDVEQNPATAQVSKDKTKATEFGMEEMNSVVEKEVGCQVLLAGPFNDFLLKDIGQDFKKQWTCTKITGQVYLKRTVPQQSWKMFILLIDRNSEEFNEKLIGANGSSWKIHPKFCDLMGNAIEISRPLFGGANDLLNYKLERRESTDTLSLSNDEYLRRLWCPQRFNGASYVKKLPYRGGKYIGRSEKTLDNEHPISFSLPNKRGLLKITYYIQRRDKKMGILAQTTTFVACQRSR